MKLIKLTFLGIGIVMLNSCASGYTKVSPDVIHHNSFDANDGVTLEYKYVSLAKKYRKKAIKKGIKLVGVKITNDTGNDLIFGKDIRLVYGNGNPLNIMDNKLVFKELKQGTATYLLYLLLTPLQFNTYNEFGQVQSSTPIGLVLGPAIAGGNMIAAGSANKNFKTELLTYDINGVLIKRGETVHGLIGITADSADMIKVEVVKKPGTMPASSQ